MTDLFGDEPPLAAEPRPEDGRRARRAATHHAPPPKRKRRGSAASFVIMLALLVGVGIGGVALFNSIRGAGGDTTASATDYPGPGSGEVEVTIPDGATGGQIGLILKDAGVVATADAFAAAYTANVNATSIRPGTYLMPQQMKASDAVALLVAGTSKADITVTIPEGFRTDQIYARIAEKLGITVDEVKTAAHDYAAFGLDGPPNTNPDALDAMEGWFYPSTYSVPPGGTAADLLKQMYDRTISELDKLGVAPENRLHVLTVGSIAIREAFFPEDWPKVTRVIENRLVPGNPTGAALLGMDSTLTYWWDVQNPGVAIDPALHNSEVNAYNTRKVTGLPPSPIASIDSSVMAAAVTPEEGDWVYFVSTDLCSGVTTFTADLAEFNSLVAQFRAWNEKYVAGGSVCPVPEG